MEFKEVKRLQQEHAKNMFENQPRVFITDVTGDEVWETYLSNFPEKFNGIYRERRAHDCSACRSFIKRYGNIVIINDDLELVSLWDFETHSDEYQPSIDALSQLVKSRKVTNVFFSIEEKVGIAQNREMLEDGTVHTWNHFSLVLPKKYVDKSELSLNSKVSDLRSRKGVFYRSLDEIEPDSVNTVLELIHESSIYRGEEWGNVLQKFSEYQSEFTTLPESKKDNYAWLKSSSSSGAVAKIKNHSIGTLLSNLSDGMDIVLAIKKYEKIVAPENYKRPKSIYTKKMIESAQKELAEMGLTNSIGRRYAQLSDVSVNDVLYSNVDARSYMSGGIDEGNIFQALQNDVQVSEKLLKRATPIGIEDFIANILPSAEKIQILLENKHKRNCVSLIAPKVANSKTMFKWDNGFSWAYNGNITDSSMKENVRRAGGKIDGVLRFSIQWNDSGDNQIDFDAHAVEPNGNHIFYQTRGYQHKSSGRLDVDIISPGNKVAVENITWVRKSLMQKGRYLFFVHNYSFNRSHAGFSAEIEYNGVIHKFEYDQTLGGNERVTVAEFDFSKNDGIVFKNRLNTTNDSVDIWGAKSNQFHDVSLMCLSPNFWGDNATGNKHYMFIVPEMKNEDDQRPSGFFNEFLKQDLMKYKKVFAAISNKMRVDDCEEQLTGLGFSSTKRASVHLRVDNKVFKVVF